MNGAFICLPEQSELLNSYNSQMAESHKNMGTFADTNSDTLNQLYFLNSNVKNLSSINGIPSTIDMNNLNFFDNGLNHNKKQDLNCINNLSATQFQSREYNDAQFAYLSNIAQVTASEHDPNYMLFQQSSIDYSNIINQNFVSNTNKQHFGQDYNNDFSETLLSEQTCYNTPESMQKNLSPIDSNGLGLGLALNNCNDSLNNNQKLKKSLEKNWNIDFISNFIKNEGIAPSDYNNLEYSSNNCLPFNSHPHKKNIDLNNLFGKCKLLDSTNKAQDATSKLIKKHPLDVEKIDNEMANNFNNGVHYIDNYSGLNFKRSKTDNNSFAGYKNKENINAFSAQNKLQASYNNLSEYFNNNPNRSRLLNDEIYSKIKTSNSECIYTDHNYVKNKDYSLIQKSIQDMSSNKYNLSLDDKLRTVSAKTIENILTVDSNLSKSCLDQGEIKLHQKPPNNKLDQNFQNQVKTEQYDTFIDSDTKKDKEKKLITCPHEGCNGTFKSLSFLKSHMNTHTKDRPFKCMYCKASFSRKHDLKRHTRIHTGDKPHKCKYCGRGFARTDALSRHCMYGPCSTFYSKKLLCMLNMNMDLNLDANIIQNNNMNRGIGMDMIMNSDTNQSLAQFYQ
ncbi:hypothetical protein BB561_001173 [Smittium simulii]|uniref:C2H2-type domain-containing protein n=1 Tax=Smittium simulii TaxID=133385 RepID=A0A2T9YVT4_9FUNG|nr:hypothetical protein BB561_001173 [Smittium simulii]